jgi:hypothetical protein
MSALVQQFVIVTDKVGTHHRSKAGKGGHVLLKRTHNDDLWSGILSMAEFYTMWKIVRRPYSNQGITIQEYGTLHSELKNWGEEILIPRGDRALMGAEIQFGNWCRFCKAEINESQSRQFLELAKLEFKAPELQQMRNC